MSKDTNCQQNKELTQKKGKKKSNAGAPDKAKQKILEKLQDGTIKLYLLQGKAQAWICEKIGVSKERWFHYADIIPELSDLLHKYRVNRLAEYLESADKLAQGYAVTIHTVEDKDGVVIKKASERYIAPDSQMLRFLIYQHSRKLEKEDQMLNDIDSSAKLEELEIKRRELEIKERELEIKEELLKRQAEDNGGIGVTDDMLKWFEDTSR